MIFHICSGKPRETSPFNVTDCSDRKGVIVFKVVKVVKGIKLLKIFQVQLLQSSIEDL